LPEPLPQSASPRPRSWEYALGASVVWDSNVAFLVPDGQSGVALQPSGGVARTFAGPRGQLRLTAAGSWIGYPDQSAPDRQYADFAVEGRHRPSPGTLWRGGASYGFGYSDSSRILLEQGVFLPLVKAQSSASAAGLSQDLGKRTSMRIDGRYFRTVFDSPGFVDGESIRGTVALDRRISGRSTAAIEYSLEGVLSDREGDSYLTHFGSLQWTRTLSPRSAILLEVGASYTPDAARAGLDRKESFFGGASFSRQLDRSNVTLFVRREVAPAFGIGGSREEVRAGLNATVPMGRRWEVRMTGRLIQPRVPEDIPQHHGSGHDAYVALGRRVHRHLELSVEGRYRRRGATSSVATLESIQAGLFLTLITPSAREIFPTPGR
jgi:hypothetical protein